MDLIRRLAAKLRIKPAANRHLFGPGGEVQPQRDRKTIKRDQGGHERWADAILPADAEAGVIETPTNRKPLYVVALIVVACAGVLALQLFKLQIVEGARNLGLADGNRLRQKITRAPRGIIYDRQNKPLVENLGNFDVTVTPSLLPRNPEQRQALYAKVAELLEVSPQEVAAKTESDCIKGKVAAKQSQSRAQFECLADTQPRLIASNVNRDIALNFDQAANNVPGYNLDTNPIRQYKDQTLLSAILGYTGRVSDDDLLKDRSYAATDYIGKLGIEKQYEEILRGHNGSEQREVDASGRPIKLLSSQHSEAGQNLVLTVDMQLQQVMTDAITKQMQAAGSKQAAGVALNPKTGEVLAAVNIPSYDNNLFAGGISQQDYLKLINDKAQPLFNKAFAGGYPVGSIIKPLIGSAALQEHTITPQTSVDDTGSITIKNKYDPNISYTYRSYDPGGLGVVNIIKAIAVSSDVFFYTVGGGYGNIGGLGITKLASYYQKFGLGHKPGVDVPEQTAGRVPTPEWKKKATGEAWTVGDTYNVSIGQGDLLASPLQMAVAEAAVANGGTVYKPHLLKAIQDASGRTVKTIQPEVVAKDFISKENLDIIRTGMRQVVSASYGTACCKIEQDVPVAVAAKTGTAETHTVGAESKPNAWFTAFAPYDDPQIEIVVLIQSAGEGAQFAAPAVRETLAWCFRRPGGCVQ